MLYIYCTHTNKSATKCSCRSSCNACNPLSKSPRKARIQQLLNRNARPQRHTSQSMPIAHETLSPDAVARLHVFDGRRHPTEPESKTNWTTQSTVCIAQVTRWTIVHDTFYTLLDCQDTDKNTGQKFRSIYNQLKYRWSPLRMTKKSTRLYSPTTWRFYWQPRTRHQIRRKCVGWWFNEKSTLRYSPDQPRRL